MTMSTPQFPKSKLVLLLVAALGCSDSDESAADEVSGSNSGSGESSQSDTEANSAGGNTDDGRQETAGGQGESSATQGGSADDGGSTSGLGQDCGASTLEPGQYSDIDLEHGGLARTYDLFIPSSYDGSTPMPVVLNFHGFSSNAAQQAFFSNMNVDAEARDFIVAYPQGTSNSWNAGTCCGDAVSNGIDDVGFARAIVAELQENLCVDAARVYATGMSNGGFMSHRLACDAADVFAAVAPIAGMLVVPTGQCVPSRPISVYHAHGTADTVVPYAGGQGFPSVADSFAGWADRNGCADSTPTETFADGDVSCETYSECGAGAEVTLCTITGAGHCWPGMSFCPTGSSTLALSNDQLLDFLFRHELEN